MRKTVFLNTDREMPLLGLGVYKLTGDNEAEQAIYHATQAGYRLIDTASAYANEDAWGEESLSAAFPVRTYLSPPKSGTTLSVLEILRVRSAEVLSAFSWTT